MTNENQGYNPTSMGREYTSQELRTEDGLVDLSKLGYNLCLQAEESRQEYGEDGMFEFMRMAFPFFLGMERANEAEAQRRGIRPQDS